MKNHGVRVTAAAVGINLSLGILYSWSIISKAIPKEWGWNDQAKSWPYAIACLVFSLMMVPGGRLQDRVGPRIVATLGGILVGLGLIAAYFCTSFVEYIFCFGILAGTGIGFGYAAATPPAVKWFSPLKTGMIAGIVVSGFGLSPAYAAPLTTWLIGQFGIPTTMLCLGAAFFLVVVCLAQFLVPPPKEFSPGGPVKTTAAATAMQKKDFTPLEMLGTFQFYILWFMYACGAGAGLMVIAKLAPLAESQVNLKLGFVLVASLAVGNGGGRILAGTISDKIGRQLTLFGCFLAQACLMIVLSMMKPDLLSDKTSLMLVMSLLSALIGANYGANLAIFPSLAKDYYGLKNFGVNYGLLFTAWGIGGFLLSLLAGALFDWYKTYTYSCYIASGFLILAALITFAVKSPEKVLAAEVDRRLAGEAPRPALTGEGA